MKFPMEIIWEVWGFNGLVERKPRFLPPLFRVFPLKPETNSVIIILDRSYWQGTIGTIFCNFSFQRYEYMVKSFWGWPVFQI
jgi:hypothetical protein